MMLLMMLLLMMMMIFMVAVVSLTIRRHELNSHLPLSTMGSVGAMTKHSGGC